MNKFLEKVAKRIDLSWKSQALDNTGADLVRGKVSDWSSPEGAAAARESHSKFRPPEGGVHGEHANVWVRRHKNHYVIHHVGGVQDVAGRGAPIVGYANRRLTPRQAERLMRHASLSREKIETGRGHRVGATNFESFQENYAKALRQADRQHNVQTIKKVGVPALGAAALLGAAGYGLYRYNRQENQSND